MLLFRNEKVIVEDQAEELKSGMISKDAGQDSRVQVTVAMFLVLFTYQADRMALALNRKAYRIVK